MNLRRSLPFLVSWTVYFVVVAMALFLALSRAHATTSTSSFAATSGWTQIAQKTAGATAPQIFSSIPATYSDLLIVYDNLTMSGATSLFLYVSGDNGSTSSLAWSSSAASTTLQSGSLLIPGYRFNSGSIIGCLTSSSASPSLTTCGSARGSMWVISGGINWIEVNDLRTVNSGTITLYGR